MSRGEKMSSFTVFNKNTGEIQKVISCSDEDVIFQYNSGTEDYISGAYPDNVYYVINNTPVALPFKPSPAHTFNWVTKQWEDPRTLTDFKTQQRALIKEARTAAEYSGFTWGGSTFDSNAISQQRIASAVQLASLSKAANQPFSITWTLADDTQRTLTADEMIQVGLALGEFVQTNFKKAQALQQRIEAATTKEEVEAVVWA